MHKVWAGICMDLEQATHVNQKSCAVRQYAADIHGLDSPDKMQMSIISWPAVYSDLILSKTIHALQGWIQFHKQVVGKVLIHGI